MNGKWVVGVIILAGVVLGGWYLVSGNKQAPAPAEIVSPTEVPLEVTAEPTTATGQAVTGAELAVEGSEFAFTPAALSAKKGEPVSLTFKNGGQYPHNLTIAGLNVATKTIQPGETDTVQFTPDKAGKFAFKCTVDSHAQKGMTGTLTVE